MYSQAKHDQYSALSADCNRLILTSSGGCVGDELIDSAVVKAVEEFHLCGLLLQGSFLICRGMAGHGVDQRARSRTKPHGISPSGQSLGGIGFRGASPQAATSSPMSAAFTISSWLMSAAAFRPLLGEEMTNQSRIPISASQPLPEQSFFASKIPSLHARASIEYSLENLPLPSLTLGL